ncbi:MAG: hypothetical protein DHS20C15_14130 [Planctomycetota bacterium]|nr:MAG: hypothetical protein DHS20C15_14130 [Planctomycetota bacterium]
MLLGLAAVLRAGCFSGRPASWAEVAEPVPLRLEALAGEEFRLLPGVGPVLAGRLEAARRAAGGRLDREATERVSGVGPALLARWDLLRDEPWEPP